MIAPVAVPMGVTMLKPPLEKLFGRRFSFLSKAIHKLNGNRFTLKIRRE